MGIYPSYADGVLTYDEREGIEMQIWDLRHIDVYDDEDRPKPDWGYAPGTTQRERDRWIQQQRQEIRQEIDRLSEKLNGQATAPDRQLGYVVGRQITISGVNVHTRRQPLPGLAGLPVGLETDKAAGKRDAEGE